MKKLLALLTVLACICIASSAMAAGVKVPKTLCLKWDTYDDENQLALNSEGTIYDGTFKVKTYGITGRDRYGVIYGSAYVMPGTTTLHATYSGSNNGYKTISNYELYFDLANATGTLYYRFQNLGSDKNGSDGVTSMDCTLSSLLDTAVSPQGVVNPRP